MERRKLYDGMGRYVGEFPPTEQEEKAFKAYQVKIDRLHQEMMEKLRVK